MTKAGTVVVRRASVTAITEPFVRPVFRTPVSVPLQPAGLRRGANPRLRLHRRLRPTRSLAAVPPRRRPGGVRR